MSFLKRLAAGLLCLALLLSVTGAALAAGAPAVIDIGVSVDGRDGMLRAFEDAYPGNYYVSLTDLAALLRGTPRQFRFAYDEGSAAFRVTPGQAPAADAAQAGRVSADAVSLAISRNRLLVDDSERRYYTYRSGSDLFMSVADVQLMLDLNADFDGEGRLCLSTDRPFSPDVAALKAEGYFDIFNSVLVGDADTGEVLFSASSGRAFPVASLSKLMTYLLVSEAVRDGRVGADDLVTISQEAARISRSEDGTVGMGLSANSVYPLSELLGVMLVASSNEAAQALAEHVAGDADTFVGMMNDRADQLGLRFTHFYTPSGLPSYSRRGLPAKLQNRMSAMDLFRLSQYLLVYFPEITEITSQKRVKFEALQYETYNSNPLLFNLEGVNGLKTGSTNKAGYCLVASLPVTVGEQTHTLVVVVLGSEAAGPRGQAAELLLRWARDHCLANGFGT